MPSLAKTVKSDALECECGASFQETTAASQHRCGFKFGVSYRLLTYKKTKVILCLRCRMLSFSPKDVETRYCGKCCKFHTFTREEADNG